VGLWINISNGKIVKSKQQGSAKSLNDVTSDPSCKIMQWTLCYVCLKSIQNWVLVSKPDSAWILAHAFL